MNYFKNIFKRIIPQEDTLETTRNQPSNDDSKNQNQYLIPLFEKINNARITNELLPVRLVSIAEKGFKVKINGMFAYLPFTKLPIKYKNIEQYRLVAPYLLNKIWMVFPYFTEFKEDKYLIFCDASVNKFKKFFLKPQEVFKALVLQISEEGVWVDVGFHHQWNFGALVGIVPKTEIQSYSTLQSLKDGDNLDVVFKGINRHKVFEFGV